MKKYIYIFTTLKLKTPLLRFYSQNVHKKIQTRIFYLIKNPPIFLYTFCG